LREQLTVLENFENLKREREALFTVDSAPYTSTNLSVEKALP
jgi:hypothetical protein